jgi:ABC-type transporter Mla subunit MlaD
MATGDSVIRVSIIGDAKKLTGALKEADKSTGGLLKSTAKLAAGGFLAFQGVGQAFDFLKTSTEEADRLGDAMDRLRLQVGPEFTGQLEKTAGAFTKIGASSQDMLELEAIFADFGTTAGITDAKIAGTAESVAALATALTLSDDSGRDANAMLDLITKAAGGSAKAAKELGVTLLDNVDASTQLDNIMAQLKPKLDEATTGTGDLEQSQRELQARTEDLSAKLGEKLAPALDTVLGFILDEIDAIPKAIAGFGMLDDAIGRFGDQSLGGLVKVSDLLGTIIGALPGVNSLVGAGQIAGRNAPSSRPPEHHTTNNTNDRNTRNGVKVVGDRVGGP